ncbi:MAG: hypothetical protein WCO18_01045, partial [bacterium]
NKLSIASHLLTEHIKDIEPLKWIIRKNAVGLVDGVVSFRGLNRQEVASLLLSLRTSFETAFSIKLISKNNSEIIISEIDKLSGELSPFDTKKEGEKELSQNFFEVEKPVLIGVGDMLENLKNEIPVLNKVSDLGSKGGQNYKGHVQISSSKNSKTEDDDKGHRRHKILSIIKQKKEVTIKDISSSIKDCSEKTIQRELNLLLAEKVIKKTGERRWSKYLLS